MANNMGKENLSGQSALSTSEAPLEIPNAKAEKRKEQEKRKKHLGIILIVTLFLAVAGTVAAWVFMSDPVEPPQSAHPSPAVQRPHKNRGKAEAEDPNAVDVSSTRGRRPDHNRGGRPGLPGQPAVQQGQQAGPQAAGHLPPGAQGEPGTPQVGAPGQNAHSGHPGLPMASGNAAGGPAASGSPAQAPATGSIPTQVGAIPMNPLDVQGVTDMMARIEEMKLRTQYAREIANYNKAQAESMNAAMLMQGGAALHEPGKGAAGLSRGDVEKLIAAEAAKNKANGNDGKAKKEAAPLDRANSGKVTSIQGSGKSLWASARTLDGDIVRLDVGSKWNGGKISSITKNGVSIRYKDGHTQRIPF